MIRLNEFLRISTLGLFLTVPILGHAQDVVPVVFDQICNYGEAKILPTEGAKAHRVSSKRSGSVTIDDTDCGDMPDSLKVALKIAGDVWKGYMPDGDTLKIQIVYEDMDEIDIRTAVSYVADTSNIYYPQCLYRKISLKETSNLPDAIIHINKNTDWCVGIGNGISNNSKNLSYGLLKAFATALGFGSSIRLDNRKTNIIFNFNKGMSVFDKLIFSEDGKYMKDLNNNKRQEFKDFVQQNNEYLYIAKKSEAYKLYAPKKFDENKSLKYLTNNNSIMYYDESLQKDLVVDSVTIDILKTIGWEFKKNGKVQIIGLNIDETGITSAYQSHQFYIKADGMSITNYSWKYQLPLKNGEYETISTSNNMGFTIPQITNEDKYLHSLEGDIRGLITFSGIVNNSPVNSTYNLTLELKPHILSAKIVGITPNEHNNSNYDAVVDIYYEGSYYAYSYVEEEYSTLGNSLFSDTPYYTQFKFTDIDSWGYALINITIRNKYGSDNLTLEIPSQVEPANNYKTTGIKGNSQHSVSKIEVYNLNGIFLGCVETKSELKKYGNKFLFLKLYDGNEYLRTVKYKN